MVKPVDAERGESESRFTRDDPPPKVIWFWISLIALSAFAILFVWPSEGTGEYSPIGFHHSDGYYRQELPNPNFDVQKKVTFLLAGFLGGALVKLSLAAFSMRDSSKLASFLAIVGAALAAAFALKILPDPGAKLPLNDFPFILLFIISLVPVIPCEALCVLLRWCYGKVAMFL